MYNFGDVVLTNVQFPDTYEIKTRPGVVLYEEDGNVVLAGITSKHKEKGIYVTKKEGAPKDSVIKINYLFTVSHSMIKKTLFTLKDDKKKQLLAEVTKRLK
ncbi:hypothetical protein GF342_04030 [Candidatus Woesearchaeota archaeon]|nr:hypothetical protein [Candidatus Woesearchaeota archaeon]